MPEWVKRYDREKAVAYAHKWAYGRNPAFYDYSRIGGDCTNFASQVLFAGSGVMNYGGETGWYYKNANEKSPSWTGVEYLYKFLIRNRKKGPAAEETGLSGLLPGDIVQLLFDGTVFGHSPVVVSAGIPAAPDNILLAAHTFNADNRPLSTYMYRKARCLHITGVYI